MDKLPVSVLVHTLNEEKNIRNCLETVKWADEIIIVDMYSDDKTTEIASEYTDKIFYHERMGYADPARQFGLEKASNEWILILDADELVPLKLKKRLETIIEEDLGDIISIPRNNYFFGKVMRHTGWGPLQDTLHRFSRKNTFLSPIKYTPSWLKGRMPGYTKLPMKMRGSSILTTWMWSISWRN